MYDLPPDDIRDPRTGSKAQGKRPISNAQGKRPVTGPSPGLMHAEFRNSYARDQRCTPGPASKPVPELRNSYAQDRGYIPGPASRPVYPGSHNSNAPDREFVADPASRPVHPELHNINAQDQGCIAGPSSRPARSQTVSSTSTVTEPRDSFDIDSESIPTYHNGSTQFFAGSPGVPSEASRGGYEHSPHHNAPVVDRSSYPAMQVASTSFAAQPSYREDSVSFEHSSHNAGSFVDGSSCPATQVASTSSAAQPSYQGESISYVAAIQMKREQKRRKEQELEEEQRRLAWEEYNNMTKERKRKEDERKSRFERPKTVEERENCIRKHMDMLSQRASHVCKGSHCFEEACTIDLPERQGCRYADSFHSQSTSPCVWGWGLMVRAFSSEFGENAAMETSLDEIADWYRQRCKHGQRIRSLTLVRDPPGAPVEGRNVFWVIPPAELNGQSSGSPIRK
jgi:hypothetical protein